MRLRVLSNHSSHASIACPSPAEREAKRLAIEERVRASAGFVPESPPVYLQPGGCSDDLLRARASRFSSECAHFLEEIWLPWRRHATAKQQVAPSACLSYPTERSGIGNWLPVVLDAAIAAAKAGARLQIKHHGNPGFFSAMGVRLDDAVAPCETSLPLPRMSWAYLPVNGVTQPTDVGLRSGWTPSTAPMLGCAFSLFTCPTASLTSAIHQLRTSLPIAHVAVHARFGHQSADQEGGFTRALNQAWERAQHDASLWVDAADRTLPLRRRLGPFDRLLSHTLPGLCRALCETRQGSDRVLPQPFMCCGRGNDLALMGDAVERALVTTGHVGARSYLTTDLAGFQEFIARFLSDAFLQQTGAILHSGSYGHSRLQNSINSSEQLERGATKTAADFLLLQQARVVVALNPSTFSGVAAGLSRNGTLLHATGRTTCGLRNGRRCEDMRARAR
jgi:hypothetical protein